MGMMFARKRSWIKLFVKLFCLIVLTVAVCVPAFTIVNFSRHVDRLLFYLEIGDSAKVQRELGQLHYFYALSEKWKIQWLADRYFFRDAIFYQAADAYLIGDWKRVKSSLKDQLDDPRSYLYGIAKFREAQAEYRATHKIEAPLNFVMTEVRDDFERDLRNCLKVSDYLECFDRVKNYDIASDEEAAGEAIKQEKAPPEHILGPLKVPEEKAPGGPEPDGELPGGKNLDEKQPGGGGPRRMP